MPEPLKPPTPEDLRAFLAKHNLTRQQFADLLPVSIKTVETWLSGKYEPLSYFPRALRDLERELKRKK